MEQIKLIVPRSASANLTANLVYTATITTGVQDMAGNALVNAKTWSFTTVTVVGAGPAPVDMLSVSSNNFVILSASGITHTGSHTSAITGNIGASPITAASMDGVWCSEITGTIYGVDPAYTGSGNQSCFAGTAADKIKGRL